MVSRLTSTTLLSDLFLKRTSSVMGIAIGGKGKLPEEMLSFLDLNFLKRKLLELVGEEDNFEDPESETEDSLLFDLGNKMLNPLAFAGAAGSSGFNLSPTCNLASLVVFPFFFSLLLTINSSSSSSAIDPMLSVLLLLVSVPLRNVRPLVDISVLALRVSFALIDCEGWVMS